MTLKRFRQLTATATMPAALILTAIHGTLDWMAILAFGAMLGLPEAAKLLQSLRKTNDSCDPR